MAVSNLHASDFVLDVIGLTALHWACKYGNTAMVDVLVGKYGASVNAKSRGGYTPLSMAALHQKSDAYKLLVNLYGADPEVRDYSGRKARQYFKQVDETDAASAAVDPQQKLPVPAAHQEFLRKAPARTSSFFRGFLTSSSSGGH